MVKYYFNSESVSTAFNKSPENARARSFAERAQRVRAGCMAVPVGSDRDLLPQRGEAQELGDGVDGAVPDDVPLGQVDLVQQVLVPTPGNPAVEVEPDAAGRGVEEEAAAGRGVEEEAAAVRALDVGGGHETTELEALAVGRELDAPTLDRGPGDVAAVGASGRHECLQKALVTT